MEVIAVNFLQCNKIRKKHYAILNVRSALKARDLKINKCSHRSKHMKIPAKIFDRNHTIKI